MKEACPTMHRRSFIALAATAAATRRRRPALAQGNWPARPVRLVVAWPPGGSVDTIARILQPRLQEALGQPLVIDNKGGASGSIGAAEAARAAPDGYTWLLAYDTTATNETVMRLPYKAMEAFAPVSLVATGPLCMVAHKDQPYQAFRDVVEAAKRKPGDINYATSGVGGLAHVATTLLQQQGGFQIAHVPYRGAGPAVQDAMAGHVPLFMSNVVVINQHIKAGTLRPLGVTTPAKPRTSPAARPSPSRASAASRRRPGGRCRPPRACRRRSSRGCTRPWPACWPTRKSARSWRSRARTSSPRRRRSAGGSSGPRSRSGAR